MSLLNRSWEKAGVRPQVKKIKRVIFAVFFIWTVVGLSCTPDTSPPPGPPVPLLAAGRPVDWWFVFKFNAANFPGCRDAAVRACLFGGDVRDYPQPFGQQFVYASSEDQTLREGSGCLGDTMTDPVIEGCTTFCSAPWGHSKGMLAWNASGDGLVMQVSTPSWPAAGSRSCQRPTDGNTLGCVNDNNVMVSQHFFALKLAKDDVVKVLAALANASVVTDPANLQIVRNGGPADIRQLVAMLGKKSTSRTPISAVLSSGVMLISKPSDLNVPPWQMVSAVLGGTSLRTATWWATPEIYSTTSATTIGCWDASLGKPGAVEIATTGNWEGRTLGLTGGDGTDFNHAKIGVSTAGSEPLAIFGDLNQQGTLSGPYCGRSQNGRGGLFFVVRNRGLHDAMASLIAGSSAPTQTAIAK